MTGKLDRGKSRCGDGMGMTALSLQERAQHPGILLMHLHALREEIDGRLVLYRIDGREEVARRPDHRLLAFDQLLDHRLGAWIAGLLRNRSQGPEGRIGARRLEAE